MTKALPVDPSTNWLSSGRTLRGQAGVTIAEVLVAVVTFGVILGGAALHFPSLIGGVDLKGAAREVYGELSSARMSAVAANTHYRFVIGEGRTYKLHADSDSDNTIDDSEMVMTKKLGQDRIGVQFAVSDDIVFAPDGTALSSGSIVVTGAGGEQKTVVVNAAGYVRIQ